MLRYCVNVTVVTYRSDIEVNRDSTEVLTTTVESEATRWNDELIGHSQDMDESGEWEHDPLWDE
jgi:hypothetical protein